ncbi:MAG: DUF4129 domain-containing protein [Bowdeniella nasicola]|nr:DUF4129 domain-containing protein [Bowdeniella nasicola]
MRAGHTLGWLTGAAAVAVTIGSLGPAVRTRPVIEPPERPSSSGSVQMTGTGEEVIPPRAPDFAWLLQSFGLAIMVVTLAGVIFAIVILARRTTVRIRPPEPHADDGALFSEIIHVDERVTLSDLRQARRALADPARAPSDRVVALWTVLEERLAGRVGERSATTTPAQWAGSRLVASGAPEDVVETLVELYYRARYRVGTRSDEHDVARARRALEAIEEALS